MTREVGLVSWGRMSRPNVVGERLRAYVRARVKKDGPHYKWGNASRLAEFLKVDNGWVTEYTDRPPSSHADIDTALEICRFYRVKIADFQSDVEPVPSPTTPPPTPHEARALRLMERMNEQGQRIAVKTIAGYADEFPKRPSQESGRRSLDSASARARKARGSR